MRVLLVEDDTMIGKGLVTALSAAGMSVDWVRDGAEAESAVRDEGYAIVLLDLGLPGHDGLEVLRRLRADGRTKLTPVVILTSSREERDIVESYRLGVNSYIVKPVDFEQFVEAVQQLGLYWMLLNQAPMPR